MSSVDVFPLAMTWRASLVLVGAFGLAVSVLAAAELTGVAAAGSLLGATTGAERLAALAGLLFLPFVISALRHGRVRIDERSMGWLGFGILCRTVEVPLAAIRRHGSALATNRGRRERILLLELADGSVRSIKIAMYRDSVRLLERLAERLGPPAAAVATLAGVRFEQPI